MYYLKYIPISNKNSFKNTLPQKYAAGALPYIAYDPSDYHCGIDDSPPVDTNKLWKDEPNCFDYEGMINFFMSVQASISILINLIERKPILDGI